MKQSSDDELKVKSLVDMHSKLMTKVSKDGGRLMRSTMYTSSFSIFTSMEHNWSVRAFAMLMCASKSSPSYILIMKNLLRRNNLFLIVLASCTSQNVSQTLLTFLQYCAFVRCSQSNANALGCLFVIFRDLIFIVGNYCTPINKLPKPMFGKHHAHLELPKVKVATIKLFHDFQRLHLEGWHFVEHKC